MAINATQSPPEPDWVALRNSLVAYYADRTNTGLRDTAFVHVYEAIRYLARRVVARNLHRSQGSVTDVSESIVDRVFKKSFTDIAMAFDPNHKASFRTWATTVLNHEFVNWCRRHRRGPDFSALGTKGTAELEEEWGEAVRDIADCDFDGSKRPGVVTSLVANEELQTRDEKKALLRIAIEKLPEEQRQVILVDEGKETQKAAATRLGMSLATYKRRKNLALAQLRGGNTVIDHTPTQSDPDVAAEALVAEVIAESRDKQTVDRDILMELVSIDDRNIYTLPDDEDPLESFVRVDRFQRDGQLCVRKEYRGLRCVLTALERRLLVETDDKDLTRTVSFSDMSSRKIARKKTLQIVQPYVGVDLEKWSVLSQRAGRENPFCSVDFLLNFVHQALEALSELHKAGFVHCDVKLNNFCAPAGGLKLKSPTANSSGKFHVDGVIELGRLTIIDLGLTLSCNPRARQLARDPDAYAKNGAQGVWLRNLTEGYVAGSYREATEVVVKTGRFDSLEAVNWRADLYSLGYTVRQLLVEYGRHLNPADPGFELLQRLPDTLQAFDKTVGSGADQPHETLIGDIGRALHGKVVRSQPFSIPLHDHEVEAVKSALQHNSLMGQIVSSEPVPRRTYAKLAIPVLVLGAIAAVAAVRWWAPGLSGGGGQPTAPVSATSAPLVVPTALAASPPEALPDTTFKDCTFGDKPERKSFDAVLSACTKVLDAASFAPELKFVAAMNRAYVRSKMEFLEPALSDLKLAESLNPADFRADLARAAIWSKRGNHPLALVSLDAAIGKGWRNTQESNIDRDPDFQPLLQGRGYQRIRDKLKTMK